MGPSEIDIKNLSPSSLPDCHDLLRQMAKQCNQWADQSTSGGWSTHQVDPNRDAAGKIYAFLDRKS